MIELFIINIFPEHELFTITKNSFERKPVTFLKIVYPQRNDVQEVVPLFMDDAPSIMTNNNPSASSSITDNTVAVRLSIQGISVEIANRATQELIKNTISALQFLCWVMFPELPGFTW